MQQVDFFINQKLLDAWQSQKRYVVAHSGRGVGKSIQMGAICILYALQNPNSRILAIRGTQNKISESSLEILKDVINMMQIDSYFDMTEHTLKCKNGSEFLFYGGKNYQSFKSLQGINLVFIDEATELSQSAWEVLIPTIRDDNSRFLISFNPEVEDDWVYQQFVINNHPDAYVAKLSIEDNPYFPETLKREMEYDKERDYLKYLHIWEGQLIQHIQGALWKKDLIKYIQREELEKIIKGEFDKIVVAIDPSITSKQTSDECGIIVAAKDKEKYVVLEDASAILSPQLWAEKAVALYNKYKADHIVYESNQGGDLTKTVINNINPTIRCLPVHASRGKILRAEPILQLYEQDKVRHLKCFRELEYEMLTYTGDTNQKSPNRLDALVYALSDLAKVSRVPTGMVRADMKNMGRMTLKTAYL